jgi:hypothetical protein
MQLVAEATRRSAQESIKDPSAFQPVFAQACGSVNAPE